MVGGIDPIDTIKKQFSSHNAHRPIFHSLKVNGTFQTTQSHCTPRVHLAVGRTVGGCIVSSMGLSIRFATTSSGRDSIFTVSETHVYISAVHSHHHGPAALFTVGGWSEHPRTFFRWVDPTVFNFDRSSIH